LLASPFPPCSYLFLPFSPLLSLSPLSFFYRFLGKKRTSPSTGEKPRPRIITVGTHEPLIFERVVDKPVVRPKTQTQIRNTFYARLGMNVPDKLFNRNAINS
jgi:hypothetical protein